jgi:hypothetical protein
LELQTELNQTLERIPASLERLSELIDDRKVASFMDLATCQPLQCQSLLHPAPP